MYSTGDTAARSLLSSTIRILDQDAELEGLLTKLPGGEFKRVFLAKAHAAFAEAYARSEEMYERFETDSEYRDGFVSKIAFACTKREVRV
jgi:hypothetical protein